MQQERQEATATESYAGYDALREKYRIKALPNWHQSRIGPTRRKEITAKGYEIEWYPPKYRPGNTLGEQLEFAIKYDGINMEILSSIFQQINPEELTTYIHSQPTGKYARKIWYLYELLTNKPLPVPDVATGNYVDLLPKEKYYTGENTRIRRQRINDNLLGYMPFCPAVRKTKQLINAESSDFAERSREVMKGYSPDVLRRAMAYLYTKETKSSFEIEREAISVDRTERFVGLLHSAEGEDYFTKLKLVELQNQIVDPRFKENDYRQSQNYVGETIGNYEKVHFVPPKPEDITELMDGIIACHGRLAKSTVHPVIHAAIISFGFVYMHPFEDGNGRMHRFLIHNVLARRSFSPPGFIFPVSAAMVQNLSDYDQALERFSQPLLSQLTYSLDEDGRMTVDGITSNHYRYIDLTSQAEALFEFIKTTVDTELPREVNFLQAYDSAKKAMQQIVDMPDRDIDLFIKLCQQNNGKISAKKRDRFSKVTDDEISKLEEVVRRAFSSVPRD
jgi:Fic family protein